MDEHNANIESMDISEITDSNTDALVMGDSDSWEDEVPITPTSTQSLAKYDVDDYEDKEPEGLAKKAKTILDFAVNNSDLARLETLLSEFNPFKVLGIADFEIRHSNALAWLIDPHAHHGLGDSLFKNMILEVLRKAPANNTDLPKIADIIGADFRDLLIHREWKNIDVFAISPKNNIAVVIENKIYATEGEAQLEKYVGIVDKAYPDYRKVFIYLTLDGDTPKGSDRYIIFDHKKIYRIVKDSVELRKDHMHVKVFDFIMQYLKILEEKTMQNEEFVSICTKLYVEHKDAITAIMTYGKPTLPIGYLHEFHNKTNTTSFMRDNNSIKSQYVFTPNSWVDVVPMTNLQGDKYLIPCSFHFIGYDNHEIVFYLWLGNFPDQDERKKLIEALRSADKDNRLSFRTANNKTSTIFSKSIPLKHANGNKLDLHDYEAIKDKLIDTYNSPDVQEAIKVVDGVVQSFGFKK